jgi:hypothetical protein
MQVTDEQHVRSQRKHSDNRQRQAQVAVRFTPAEFATLRAVAARKGQSLACALREGFLRDAEETR